ncbi:MAG: glycosyltransferase family 39 protein [Candidatus Aminicenantes bacterium]
MNNVNTSPDRNFYKINRAVPIAFLLILLFFAAWIRFEGITQQGISGGDCFRYLKEAKSWAEGQPSFFGGIVYRPASFFVQGMAIKIFGYNDYSIKILHGIMDMISILLVFFIAFILVGNLWAGVVSSLIYAFLPQVVLLVRSEFLQVESTFFVLLALFFFVLFAKRKNRNSVTFIFLFISGFCSGLAANTHPDLAFLAPGFVLFLFIKSYNSQKKSESLKEFAILSFIFTFGFFTPYLIGFFLFGFKKVIQVFSRQLTRVQSILPALHGDGSKPSIFFNIFYHSIKYYFGKQTLIMGILLVGTIFVIIYRKMKKESDSLLDYFPLMLIFSYAFFYTFFLSALPIGRILMPLLPLVILILTQWYYKTCVQLFGKYSVIVFTCFFIIIFMLNPKTIPGRTKYIHLHRMIHNILKDHVNPGNKLLIAPAAVRSLTRGFQCDLYFGNNAIYMFQLPIKGEYNLNSLKELVKDKNIRYLFLGKALQRVLLKPGFPVPPIYRNWLRNKNFNYSVEKDLEIIHAYIRSRGGLLINKNNHGKIYYLTDKKLEPTPGLIANGSFEYWWEGFPTGEWQHLNGVISRSGEAVHGSSSIRFQSYKEQASGIRWVFDKSQPWLEYGAKIRVRMDAKAGKSDSFIFYLVDKVKGKWQKVKPRIVRYTGNGDWMTLSRDFTLTPGTKLLFFTIQLQAGAREPAYADNLSIELLK